ncbi:hypothetical protein A2U01_0080177, partial [Trifolium medium]|nr:hypothetical protein [Trifolium medium]
CHGNQEEYETNEDSQTEQEHHDEAHEDLENHEASLKDNAKELPKVIQRDIDLIKQA